MKVYSRIARHHVLKSLGGRKGVQGMKWAMSLKPGDLIHTCSSWPFNTRVKDIPLGGIQKWQWGKGNSNRRHGNGWMVTAVEVLDISDRTHYYPGGGCVGEALTIREIHALVLARGRTAEEVREYAITQQKNWGWTPEAADRFVQDWADVKNEISITDDHGIYLPR